MFFVKVSCPFLHVEYESQYKSHPDCWKLGRLLDTYEVTKDNGCTGCEILDLTPTERLEKYFKMFPKEKKKKERK